MRAGPVRKYATRSVLCLPEWSPEIKLRSPVSGRSHPAMARPALEQIWIFESAIDRSVTRQACASRALSCSGPAPSAAGSTRATFGNSVFLCGAYPTVHRSAAVPRWRRAGGSRSQFFGSVMNQKFRESNLRLSDCVSQLETVPDQDKRLRPKITKGARKPPFSATPEGLFS
jgi:hypothetical protein